MRCAHRSFVFVLYLFQLGASWPIPPSNKPQIEDGSIILPREPIPAPPPEPPHDTASNPVTPPQPVVSLPKTPSTGVSDNLPVMPAGHVYQMIDVTPSHSGSPYDVRRFKGLTSNIKALELKSKSYRKTAVKNAIMENQKFKSKGQDAGELNVFAFITDGELTKSKIISSSLRLLHFI